MLLSFGTEDGRAGREGVATSRNSASTGHGSLLKRRELNYLDNGSQTFDASSGVTCEDTEILVAFYGFSFYR